MFSKKIKNILLGCTAIIGIVGATFFPSDTFFQAILSSLVFMVVFPYLIIHFILKEPVASYGCSLPQFTSKLFFQTLFLFLLAFGIFFLLFALTPFGTHYFPPTFLSQKFLLFFLYSVLGGGAFSLIFSAFFQGFLLSFFQSFAKEWAVLLQWFCLALFLFIIGKLDWSMTPYLYISLFSGAIVSLSRSFPLGFLFSWIFVILIDIFLLKFF